MELQVTAKGSGKYIITDAKEREIYHVTKTRKLFGSPITTLYDVSGYALYTMKRTSAGKKPEYEVQLNERFFMKVLCKSMFIDPSIQFETVESIYELKGKDQKHFVLYKNQVEIGMLDTAKLVNNDLVYKLVFDDQLFDDFFPLFAVAADKCFGEMNK
ncbi:MAG: hypothetical protein IJJ69_10185 [Oscillospiraceae bacterium]|nr:hypothetical protein [Oscillospiraceae bacterium]